MAESLNLSSLSRLPDTVGKPGYSRESLSAGILHFGPGNFHKAHQAVYLDRLLNQGIDHDWAIVGASVMPSDAALRKVTKQQDYLTTVVTQSAEVSEAQITAAMIDYLEIGDTAAILNVLADPAIRIVSLTVTEGGYFVDASTGQFDTKNPAIVADVDDFDHPETVFGLIVKALDNRKQSGQKPFTIMSCDNLPHNGNAAKQAVVGLAKMVDPSLADWIEKHARFPNGMVDRITPATSDLERDRVSHQFGINDQLPVFCEDYIQWVLEDNFVDGRPAFEQVGVEIVPDVSPYELMKIRILNGGHAVLAYPAALLGFEYVHEALQDPRIREFLEAIEKREIIPVVPEVPGINLNDYCERVLVRFANPAIADTISRLCFDGSNRQPKFIIPSISDRLVSESTVTGLALSSAFWCRYCEGVDESGNTISPNDPSWELLHETALASRTDPQKWINMPEVYGALGQNERFKESFINAIEGIRSKGVSQMLIDYCNQ